MKQLIEKVIFKHFIKLVQRMSLKIDKMYKLQSILSTNPQQNVNETNEPV